MIIICEFWKVFVDIQFVYLCSVPHMLAECCICKFNAHYLAVHGTKKKWTPAGVVTHWLTPEMMPQM